MSKNMCRMEFAVVSLIDICCLSFPLSLVQGKPEFPLRASGSGQENTHKNGASSLCPFHVENRCEGLL